MGAGGLKVSFPMLTLISRVSEHAKGPLLTPSHVFRAVHKAEGAACGFMCVGHYEKLLV